MFMNMKKYLIIIFVALTMGACTRTTTKEFRAPDNSVVATCTYQGDDSLHAEWQFTDADGNPLVKNCDSLRVVELGPEGHPTTICFHVGNTQHWRQYYTTMQLRSEGATVNGLREGRWIFYFPNGTPQAESNFVAGREEGPYKVFRENGVPYYMGMYHEGQRTGTWEIYNPDGTLATTQQY